MKILRVNRFSEKLYNAVVKLLPEVASEREVPSKQFFKSILASGNVHFFVAELDDRQIAGMLTIGTYNTPSGMKVWIEDVVVDKERRGKGIGKELMLAAVDYSRSLGADMVQLTSRPSRTAANRLYRNLGFEQYETNVYKFQLR
jgi:ribosomal protein S18 acetylase RimI-like enzyme